MKMKSGKKKKKQDATLGPTKLIRAKSPKKKSKASVTLGKGTFKYIPKKKKK